MARAARRRSFLSPALFIRTKAVRSGIFGDSRGWRLIAAFIFGRRLLKRVMGGVPQVIATEKLGPGQFMSIRTIDPRTERR